MVTGDDSRAPDARTGLCVLLGNPVEHSLSPAIHNAAFRAAGLNLAYLACRVEDLGNAIRGVRALGVIGASITIPHKLAVIEHLDALDPHAARVGSVNTIVRNDGRLVGSTTDGAGALAALRQSGADPRGQRVLILGAGGSARAIAMTLANEAHPASLTLLARDRGKAERLAHDVRAAAPVEVRAGELETQRLTDELRDARLLVHTTSVGMAATSSDCLVPREALRPDLTVFDIVYTPLVTELGRRAMAAGARVVPGIEMLVHQAAAQFTLWTGRPAPIDVMRAAALARLA